jgi:two-component system osmolarity sensor histidine kinase EnvZ
MSAFDEELRTGGAEAPRRRLLRHRLPLAWMRRYLAPRGLLGRALLIILLPLVILQAIALQLFYGNHLDVISRRLAAGVAGDVGMVAELVARRPDAEEQARIFRDAAWRLELGLAFEQGARMERPQSRPASLPLLPLEEDLTSALRERVALPFDTDWQSDPRSVIIRVQLPNGVLHVEAPRKRVFTGTLYLFVIWLVGASLLLFGVAALFMKNQVRAIRRLAGAAEAFGMGRDLGPIKPEGAVEVRQAASAFNRMQERIRRFVAQRTEMLAGISHDLRTPLTRMRLALAMLPAAAQEDAAALTQDVEEMERMVAAYLAFARGEGQEQPQRTDLVALVEDVAARARRHGTPIAVAAPAQLLMPLRGDALRRCLGNLLDNARRHAQRIAVGIDQAPRPEGGGWAMVIVDDDGPGIDPAQREEAFRPFASFSAGGTGLGLAIARDIARAHGGDIMLEDSPMGGLRARVRLPL